MNRQLKKMAVMATKSTFLAALAIGSSSAAMAGGATLTLVNGWTNTPYSTRAASVKTVNDVVYFTGAISNGTSPVAFTLPAGFRPLTDVYVSVGLCNTTKGRIHITPSGSVDVQEENGTFSNAQCFTSLDGANFSLTDDKYHALTLKNGWTNSAFSTSIAAVKKISGVVQFKGAIANGSNAVAFTLPNAYRPLTDVYVPVDLCNATKGRIHIVPSGVVDVEAENGAFSNAQCFTSLDGVSFAPTTGNFTALALINGWTAAPFATSNPAAQTIKGVTHFKGAMATTGASSIPFVLPGTMRPKKDVYIAVDLCSATNGRIHIAPTGTVDVQEENGTFSNAQCFTSLDGASFVN
jgi:hypothetical protein